MILRRILLAAAACLALAGAVSVLDYYWGDLVLAYERWRYPPARESASPLGEAIVKERDARWLQKVTREYGRVRAKLDEARAKGLDVSRLEPKMTYALNLARQGKYREALLHLNLIEVRIPAKRERVVPAESGEGSVSGEGRIEEEPVPSRRRRKAQR